MLRIVAIMSRLMPEKRAVNDALQDNYADYANISGNG
jgi:hypothetical protein